MNLPQVRHRHLILAAVVAGAAGLALFALGWWIVDWQFRADWGRWSEPSWWAGGLVRSLGYLAFSKVGFKVALAGIVGAAACLAWLRARRRDQAGANPGLPPPPSDGTLE
ncbi:hypothetical protein [Actinoplanes sp. NPDC049118]|uniref:hypothetical protein n=1 Tax=Actinoplanes sp. NPDC049118 TaxID=3155769 RepID=UPI0033C27658